MDKKIISLLPKGIEDLNYKIVIGKKKYVLKIFSLNRTFLQIKSYLNALVIFKKAGIPVPSLLETAKSSCVMEFFQGKDFEEIKPSRKDILAIVLNLTKIHSLEFKIAPNYDSWGTANLLGEYKLKRKYLTKKDLNLIDPIINQFQKINLASFPRCIIHGDLNKTNILKNKRGQYCLLDLGCLDFNARIVDVAIFLAQFCLDLKLNLEKNREIINLATGHYQKFHKLEKKELHSLPILIKATYAAYIIQSSYLKINKWLSLDRRLLKKLKDL